MDNRIEHAELGARDRGLGGHFRRCIAEAKLRDALLTPNERLDAKLNREVKRQLTRRRAGR